MSMMLNKDIKIRRVFITLWNGNGVHHLAYAPCGDGQGLLQGSAVNQVMILRAAPIRTGTEQRHLPNGHSGRTTVHDGVRPRICAAVLCHVHGHCQARAAVQHLLGDGVVILRGLRRPGAKAHTARGTGTEIRRETVLLHQSRDINHGTGGHGVVVVGNGVGIGDGDGIAVGDLYLIGCPRDSATVYLLELFCQHSIFSFLILRYFQPQTLLLL